ncbi:hypothetical protein J2S43_001532 [Catenuloplanes nepalensis]|uniref:Alpha-L-arabinofuranosidase B arabinose-binding domain-containing protein n=1 Tax=Catenuloplanes nepalensis TaxID=587533 RepID=A0ABT9MNM4_9ACTN|nr:AbfB domain-containing protein [Catenuloplanes nepalensis]MDP9793020.1 hypothetical protein [Catenuloplanes nepalensis]
MAVAVARPAAHPVAGAATGTVRLMSHNLPGRCLRHRGFELWLDPCAQPVEDAGFQADSSFAALNPWT